MSHAWHSKTIFFYNSIFDPIFSKNKKKVLLVSIELGIFGTICYFYILHVMDCVTWNLTFILECPEEKVAETGCLASDLYVFKTCKNRERKPAKKINGYYPHGTSCGNVMCSKQFFGFTWKTKTTKIVCECDNGTCGWSKPLHKCPTGLIFAQLLIDSDFLRGYRYIYRYLSR